MATNSLVTLAETTSKISEDISPAKAAYILSQILEKVGYDEQSFEKVAEEVSPSEQEDAIRTLSEIIGGVNSGKSYEESIVQYGSVKPQTLVN
jgi:polynucleotide 5'-kinase involved in rRNA processing